MKIGDMFEETFVRRAAATVLYEGIKAGNKLDLRMVLIKNAVFHANLMFGQYVFTQLNYFDLSSTMKRVMVYGAAIGLTIMIAPQILGMVGRKVVWQTIGYDAAATSALWLCSKREDEFERARF